MVAKSVPKYNGTLFLMIFIVPTDFLHAFCTVKVDTVVKLTPKIAHTMKRKFLMLTLALIATLAASAAEITLKQLPQKAQEFIHQYFAKDQIRTIRQHHHRSGNSYRVLFNDGSKINFDATGQWTKIKLRNDSIPVEIIPEYITTYVWEAYPDVMIMSIETEGAAKEVELSDGTELTFNPKGDVVKID